MHKNSRFQKTLLIILISVLFLLNVFLIKHISVLNHGNSLVLKIGNFVHLDKNNLIFNNKNSSLKYFFEPKPGSNKVWAPSWLNKTVVNKINADSLNDRYEYAIEKPDSTYRIITIGDSFTYGLFVETSKNFTELLEDDLNNKITCRNIAHFDVINLGVPGYDIQYTIERFIKRGIKYRPDQVIWLLTNWNFDIINELYHPFEEKFYKQELPAFNNEPQSYEIYKLIIKNFKDKFTENIIYDYQREALTRLKDNYDGKLTILTFKNTPDKYKKIIHEFISGNSNFSYFSSLKNILNDKEMIFIDSHPNINGHKQITLGILEILLNNYLNDCRTK